jgi:hypothetical protein
VRYRLFTVAYGVMLMPGMAGPGVAQDSGAQQPSAREQLQHIHSPLLEEHHDRIQSLLDKNPTASRQQLGPQIHAISNETHRKIHVLLTDHQKELEKAMQQREHNGREDRRSAPPAAASAKPSSFLALLIIWSPAEPCRGQTRPI